MNGGLTYTCKVRFSRARNGRKRLEVGSPALPIAPGRVPRVSRLMALAIKLDGLIQEGALADYAEIARVGHVTRARVTQIMNLLMLAPDIQEAILFLPKTLRGRDAIRELDLRAVVADASWSKQRCLWTRLTQRASTQI